jgi:hypothetical protein
MPAIDATQALSIFSLWDTEDLLILERVLTRIIQSRSGGACLDEPISQEAPPAHVEASS